VWRGGGVWGRGEREGGDNACVRNGGKERERERERQAENLSCAEMGGRKVAASRIIQAKASNSRWFELYIGFRANN